MPGFGEGNQIGFLRSLSLSPRKILYVFPLMSLLGGRGQDRLDDVPRRVRDRLGHGVLDGSASLLFWFGLTH